MLMHISRCLFSSSFLLLYTALLFCSCRYIGREENEACKEKRYIGSVNADHEISFEFGVRRKKQKETPKPSALDRISEVSTSLEGQCVLQCIVSVFFRLAVIL